MLDTARILAETSVARVEYHATIGSTNDRAKRCAGDPFCKLPLLVAADRQTAGRGRGSNRWWAGTGSLTFTLALGSGRVGGHPGRWGLASLAAGVAVVEALRTRMPGDELGIHWPNDVFAAGRKLAGILVEVLANRRAVIGIGVNTNNRLDDAPPEVRRRAVSLIELTGRDHDPTEVLIDLLRQFDRGLDGLATAPAEACARADALCLQRGRTLSVASGGRLVTGRCAGIGPAGALLLDTNQGRVEIVSGSARAG
jgi:BirA family transcriptional regulator, biotin operon repressor / biotin---[acetyl-CoA-carboxylase] ligase